MKDKNEIRMLIRENYGAIAVKNSQSGCCGTSKNSCGCCGDGTEVSYDSPLGIGYSKSDIASVPQDAQMSLGCGNPIAIAALKEGEVVLDLGSGGGFDCFLARTKVGDTGYVIGVDMTHDMLMLARKNAAKSGYTNVEFRLGEIEHLPVADSFVDVIISNCVINLSPEKEQVFKESYRVLKPGGRLSISDVAATAILPEHIKNDMMMMAGCVAGAESIPVLKEMMQAAGFKNIRFTPKDNSKEIISSWAPGTKIEDYVASFIIEAEK